MSAPSILDDRYGAGSPSLKCRSRPVAPKPSPIGHIADTRTVRCPPLGASFKDCSKLPRDTQGTEATPGTKLHKCHLTSCGILQRKRAAGYIVVSKPNRDIVRSATASVWVDADACPNVIKEILFRAADRTGVTVTLVANRHLAIPRVPSLGVLQVTGVSQDLLETFRTSFESRFELLGTHAA